MPFALPTIVTLLAAVFFFVLERVKPGRELPNATGWYTRAVFVTLVQVVITLVTNRLWVDLFSGTSLFKLSLLGMPMLEGFIGWFAGTFFFYWWHRLRHQTGFWVIFHQVHHSPARIEAFTSFYKHPVEILSDAALAAAVLYALLGVSLEGALWFNCFAACGELFYHSNFKAPRWLRYVIQTPELHSIHHQLDVHHFNYADLPSGTACSAPTATLTRSRRPAAFPATTSASSAAC